MHVLFQGAICICLIILAGGSMHYVHDHPTFVGGLLLFLIWGIFFRLIDRTNMFKFDKLKKKKSDSDQEITKDRITHLEKRLTDIQEVVIAIDEKLSRVERADVDLGEKIS